MTGGDLVVTNIGTLITPAGPAPRRGAELGAVRETARAAIVAAGGRIAYAGPEAEMPAGAVPAGATRLDAAGAAVVPGFVDAHTHLAYAGDRDAEIRQRLAGRSYAEIAAAGGGIVRSVAATRAADRDTLVTLLRSRLDEMLLCGTTTAEVKSGYGLETAAEIRSLEAIREAAQGHPMTIVPTFLGAHDVPPEHRDGRERYVEMLVGEMIPEVARRGLATFADAFCEEGVFTVAESRRVLDAARAAGLLLRIHADELTRDRRTICCSCPRRACPRWREPAAPRRSCPPRPSICVWAVMRPPAPWCRRACPWRWPPTAIPAAGCPLRCRSR
jgi:imidazolonepropionase